MYLFIDTETTGKPLDRKASISKSKNWPRLVQIAWTLYNKKIEIISDGDLIVKPEGFHIPEDAESIHGISTEKAISKGITIKEALIKLSSILNNCEYVIGHNIDYDIKVIAAEYFRCRMKNYVLLKKKICTMKEGTEYCAIEGTYSYKWPTLSELYYKLFKKELRETHNAAVDIEATIECFAKMVDSKILKVPSLAPLLNKKKLNQLIYMDIHKQATWLKGFIEQLTYAETISDSQIEVLNSKMDSIIEIVNEEYAESKKIIEKAILIKGSLESLIYSDSRNSSQVEKLNERVEELVLSIEEVDEYEKDPPERSSNQQFTYRPNNPPGASEISEPIDDLPF